MRWREAGPADGPVALLLHGFPNSSYLWRDVLPAVAGAGWRAVAPDFPGYGDTPPFDAGAGTWTDHVDALDAFVAEHDLAPLVLVGHDWGGLIGLRWACERPYALRGLAVMGTGFFPDARWHGLAQGLRTPGEGERMVAAITAEAFGGIVRAASPRATDEAIAEYWKGLCDDRRKAAALALYRSGDFSELERYDGCLRELDVPALVLWGADDQYAPVSGAHRFARELPRAELVVLDGVGHFLMEDAPERVAPALAGFLSGLDRPAP
jgi:haloalkane dehalogenase